MIRDKIKKLKFLAITVAVLITILLSTSAFAAGIDSRYKSNIKAYPLKDDISVYDSNFKKTSGWIDDVDECTIIEVYTNGYAKVTYPITTGANKGKTATKYCLISDFSVSASTASFNTFTATAYIDTYRNSNMSTKYGRIYPKDVCYIIGTSGSNTQVIYPLTSGSQITGWRMAFIKTSNIPKTSNADKSDSTSTAARDSAVKWAKEQINKKIGDGQCVAFVKEYIKKHFDKDVSGNGQDYWTNTGWTQVGAGNTPQPGDIVVWGGNKYNMTAGKVTNADGSLKYYVGHVAIVTAVRGAKDFDIVEQNYSGKLYVTTRTVTSTTNLLGFVRPNW